MTCCDIPVDTLTLAAKAVEVDCDKDCEGVCIATGRKFRVVEMLNGGLLLQSRWRHRWVSCRTAVDVASMEKQIKANTILDVHWESE